MERITSTEVNNIRSLSFLSDKLGMNHIAFENTIEAVSANLSSTYAGITAVMWRCVELSNGGFYMYPLSDRFFRLSNGDTLSPQGFGVLASLYAHAHIHQLDESLYFKLESFAKTHHEAAQILEAIK